MSHKESVDLKGNGLRAPVLKCLACPEVGESNLIQVGWFMGGEEKLRLCRTAGQRY